MATTTQAAAARMSAAAAAKGVEISDSGGEDLVGPAEEDDAAAKDVEISDGRAEEDDEASSQAVEEDDDEDDDDEDDGEDDGDGEGPPPPKRKKATAPAKGAAAPKRARARKAAVKDDDVGKSLPMMAAPKYPPLKMLAKPAFALREEKTDPADLPVINEPQKMFDDLVRRAPAIEQLAEALAGRPSSSARWGGAASCTRCTSRARCWPPIRRPPPTHSSAQ